MISLVIILIISVIIHEVSHGYMANKLGDPTAKSLGRLSLNPLVHIDWLGSVILPSMLVILSSPLLIGWAKPVPVNKRYFTNPSRDMMLVALAGPFSNFILALTGSWLLHTLRITNPDTTFLLSQIISINLVLGIFNLLPIPPLDGARVLAHVVPDWHYQLDRLEPYGFVIILVLAYTGVLNIILHTIIPPLLRLLL